MIATLLLAAANSAPIQSAAPRELAPPGTIAWIEMDAHVPLLEQGLEHPLIAAVLEAPLMQEELSARRLEPRQALDIAEAVVGRYPLDLLAALSDGGLGVGLVPPRRGQTEPGAFAVLAGKDPERFDTALGELLDVAERFSAAAPVKAGSYGALGEHVEEVWRTTDGELWLAALGKGRAVLAPDLVTLTRCAVGGRAPEGLTEALAELEGGGPGMRAWVDLALLDEAGELEDLRAMTSDPGAHFVLGPVLTHFGASEQLAMHATFDADAVQVRLRGLGGQAGAGRTTFPEANGEDAPLLAPGPNEVGRVVMHRDVDTLLAKRIELFRPRSLPALAEGLANLALIGGGPDAVDEVVDALGPRILVIAESLEYDDNARPDIPLPGTAFILELEGEDPGLAGARLTQAFQSLISLQNVERSMQGKLGFLLGLERVGDVTLTTAKLPAPRPGDGVDLGYNLAPACAAVGRHFVVGTHHAVVRSAIERLGSGRRTEAPESAIDFARIDGSFLRSLVEDNRDVIEMKAVLERGRTRTHASREVDTLLEALRWIDGATLATSAALDPALALDAVLTLQLADR